MIGGQDHLAVRAVGESLYTHLLPGISNVTDRVHCYAFYTWFIRAYEHGEHELTVPAFKHLFRRAECLYTLLSAFHGGERQTDSGAESEASTNNHGGGLVGRNTLLRALDDLRNGGWIDLGRYATQENVKDRYFKHSLGGFGQYYLGPMRGLGLISGDSRSGVKWTSERGLPVAEAFDRFVGGTLGQRFITLAVKGKITSTDLEDLACFCPCHLAEATEVRDLLLAMFLCEHKPELDEVRSEGEQSRRHTALLLLSIAETTPENLHWRFRKYTYAGAVIPGVPWMLAPTLVQTRSMWATYQRHELYSMAMQGLFSVGLRRLKNRPLNLDGVQFRSVADYVAAYMEEGGGFGSEWLARAFPALVEDTARCLPKLDDFDNDDHEFQRASQIAELTTSDEVEAWTQVVRHSVKVLLILAARGHGEQPAYSEFVHPPRYFQSYELNLRDFTKHCERTWVEMSGRKWLEWLVGEGTIRVHLRVALRKLRHQRKDVKGRQD